MPHTKHAPTMLKPKIDKLTERLYLTTKKLMHLVNLPAINNPDFYLLYNKYILDMFCNIRDCEIAGYKSEDLIKALAPVREMLRQSQFLKRLQDWPRGYPGDFETVEYMVNFQNKCSPGTLGYFLEVWALNLPISQQHRNKIKKQASIIKEMVLRDKQSKLIGILGCGGCADLRSIQYEIKDHNPMIVLNDMDKDALALALQTCNQLNNFKIVNKNVLLGLRSMREYGEYDLIMAGGLLDYFDNDRIVKIISLAFKLLKPDGKLFFTNIAKGNPFRTFMEYGVSWPLYEKSEEELIQACIKAGAEKQQISITRDETGLTYFVSVNR